MTSKNGSCDNADAWSAAAIWRVCPPLALGRGGESLAAEFCFPNSRWLGLARRPERSANLGMRLVGREGLSRTSFDQACAGALRPSADHCSDQPIGRWGLYATNSA